MPQPHLSRQLMDLGKKLLIRGNRRITLTEEGMLLRKRAAEIVDLTGKTVAELTFKKSVPISAIIYSAFTTMMCFRHPVIFAVKSDIASEILICWGHTASQLLHPMQAAGCLSSSTDINAMGAINPPPVKQCSL